MSAANGPDPDPKRLVSQTLLTCPHCGGDFLLNEAGDGAISVERVGPIEDVAGIGDVLSNSASVVK